VQCPHSEVSGASAPATVTSSQRSRALALEGLEIPAHLEVGYLLFCVFHRSNVEISLVEGSRRITSYNELTASLLQALAPQIPASAALPPTPGAIYSAAQAQALEALVQEVRMLCLLAHCVLFSHHFALLAQVAPSTQAFMGIVNSGLRTRRTSWSRAKPRLVQQACFWHFLRPLN